MDKKQSYLKSVSYVNSITSNHSNLEINNNFNMKNFEKKLSEFSKDKNSDNKIFYTNSIINAAKNATKSIIRSNSTSSIAQGKNEPNLDSNPRNGNFAISNNIMDKNNSNYKNFDIDNYRILKKNSSIMENNFNNYLVKNISKETNFSEQTISNTNSNSHANSLTNTGTHNSKNNMNLTSLNCKNNSKYDNFRNKEEIDWYNDKNNIENGKICPFIPKPANFPRVISSKISNNCSNSNKNIDVNSKENLNENKNIHIKNEINYFDNTFIQNLEPEKQEGKKSFRKVIDLNYLNQATNTSSSGANIYLNSNSVLETEESKPNNSFTMNTFEKISSIIDSKFSKNSNFLLNENEDLAKGPVRLQKELLGNMRSVSPYLTRLEAHKPKSGINNKDSDLIDEGRKISKNFYEEIKKGKNLINNNLMNNNNNNFEILNKFEGHITNGIKININQENLDFSNSNTHLSYNLTSSNSNNNNNLNTYEKGNYISKDASFIKSISNVNVNYSDDKNHPVADYNHYLRDLSVNVPNAYLLPECNSKLLESKYESSDNKISNSNSKLISNPQNNNNYAMRNLDIYLNNQNNSNDITKISPYKNNILSPNNDPYSRKPYNITLNVQEISNENKYNNNTIDLSNSPIRKSNINNNFITNNNKNNNFNRHQSKRIHETSNINNIKSAIHNTNLPSNNISSCSNYLNSNIVYASSKSIGKNSHEENKLRDNQIGNVLDINKNKFYNNNNVDNSAHKEIDQNTNLNHNLIYTKNSSQRSVSKRPINQIAKTNLNSNNNQTNLDSNSTINVVCNPSFNRSSSTKNMGLANQMIYNEESNNYNEKLTNKAANVYKTITHRVFKNINFDYKNNSLINPNDTDSNEYSNKNSNLDFPVNTKESNNFNNNNNYTNFAKIPDTNSHRETINSKNFSFGSKFVANPNTINSNFHNPFNTLDNPASINNCNKTNLNTDNNNYLINNSNQTKIRKNKFTLTENDFTINLEDLLMIEEKLFEILSVINKGEITYHECFDWWNLYFNCSLCGSFQHYFKDPQNKQIVSDYTFSELIAICLTYDSCFDFHYYQSINYILKTIFNLLHENFLILCDYFLSKISYDSLENIWVRKLEELISQNLKLKDLKNNHAKEIKGNNKCLLDYIRLVLKNHPDDGISDPLYAFLNNFAKLTVSTLNDFFRSKIIRIENKKASNLASCLMESGDEELKIVEAPYLKDLPLKEYCLVLDLDETLIHFKIDPKDDASGVLRLRPGIYKFLDEVSKFYEIIVFTAATSDYADPILDAIENNKKYFSYVFYREHTVIEENDYVKDISLIGRDLSKILIVDNMPQNFRLQKENGILIKTFYGEDQNDKALLELFPILIEMGKTPGKDLREILALFKDEILKKVSSNLSRK